MQPLNTDADVFLFSKSLQIFQMLTIIQMVINQRNVIYEGI